MTMRTLTAQALTCFITIALSGCGDGGATAKDAAGKDAAAKDGDDGGSKSFVLYCGRSTNLVEPLIEKFEQETGIKVQMKAGGTPELALTIQQEGDRSPADLFWAQDAGALGALASKGLLAELPDDVYADVRDVFRSKDKSWVGTSGRARVLAYSPLRIKKEELPLSVYDLTDDKWKGRVGWAPSNGSFKAFLTAMRVVDGQDKARQWLMDMKANEPKVYPKNTPIVEALAAGEIDLGLPNHYYLLRFKADDPSYPVSQTFFKDGDIGNLVFVAGVGIVKAGKHQDAALKFVRFLLSKESQAYFTTEVHEYPVTKSVEPNEELLNPNQLAGAAPDVKLEALDDLAGTEKLLKEVGLLP